MESVPSKIQLDSVYDLQYLIQQFQSGVVGVLQQPAIQKLVDEVITERGVQDASQVQQEVEQRLERWISLVFEMAGHGIEVPDINQEYEPIDEQARARLDQLQYQVQESLVKVAQLRKSVPLFLQKLNKESAESISKNRIGAVVHDPEMSMIQEDMPTLKENIVPQNYEHLVRLASQLKQKLPTSESQITQINQLLDILQIPKHGGASMARKSVSKSMMKKRRSSVGLRVKDDSPRQASFNLLGRLETEAKRRAF